MQNKILAKVNGMEITEALLQQTIEKMPRERQAYFQSKQGMEQLLDQVIAFELIHKDAVEKDFEKEQGFKDQFEVLKKEVLTQYAISKVLAEVSVEDKEINEYYESNKAIFMEQPSVRAKHILVPTEEEVQKIAQEINEGLSFEEAAQKYSTCPSKEAGGDLGTFTKGRMVPEFENAAFTLAVSEMSAPVKTQFGYHLIKVEEKNEGKLKELEEVKETITGNLLQEKQTTRYYNLTEELKGKYGVEYVK